MMVYTFVFKNKYMENRILKLINSNINDIYFVFFLYPIYNHEEIKLIREFENEMMHMIEKTLKFL